MTNQTKGYLLGLLFFTLIFVACQETATTQQEETATTTTMITMDKTEKKEKLLRHVVIFKFKDESSEEDVNKLNDAFNALADSRFCRRRCFETSKQYTVQSTTCRLYINFAIRFDPCKLAINNFAEYAQLNFVNFFEVSRIEVIISRHRCGRNGSRSSCIGRRFRNRINYIYNHIISMIGVVRWPFAFH